ncbi:MAG: hypothetical protein ACOX61_06090 [Brooklawnia sp.]|jgi:PhnB protein
MAIGLTPYLMFDGTARQAVEFYHSVLGGELTTTTFGEGMPPEQSDPATADRIMHASLFVSPRLHIMASDTIPGMGSATNGTISLSADGNDAGDAKVLQGYWDAQGYIFSYLIGFGRTPGQASLLARSGRPDLVGAPPGLCCTAGADDQSGRSPRTPPRGAVGAEPQRSSASPRRGRRRSARRAPGRRTRS